MVGGYASSTYYGYTYYARCDEAEKWSERAAMSYFYFHVKAEQPLENPNPNPDPNPNP